MMPVPLMQPSGDGLGGPFPASLGIARLVGSAYGDIPITPIAMLGDSTTHAHYLVVRADNRREESGLTQYRYWMAATLDTDPDPYWVIDRDGTTGAPRLSVMGATGTSLKIQSLTGTVADGGLHLIQVVDYGAGAALYAMVDSSARQGAFAYSRAGLGATQMNRYLIGAAALSGADPSTGPAGGLNAWVVGTMVCEGVDSLVSTTNMTAVASAFAAAGTDAEKATAAFDHVESLLTTPATECLHRQIHDGSEATLGSDIVWSGAHFTTPVDGAYTGLEPFTDERATLTGPARSLYAIGNSLTMDSGHNNGGIKALCATAGLGHLAGYHQDQGSTPIEQVAAPTGDDAHWPVRYSDHDQQPWDGVMVQPWQDAGVDTDSTAALVAACQTLIDAGPSDTDIYLYQTWQDRTDFPGEWEDADSDGNLVEASYDTMMSTLVAAYPSRTVTLVPVGQVFFDIDADITANGAIGTVSSLADLYSDTRHLNDLGDYVAGLVVASVVHGVDPNAFSHPGTHYGSAPSAPTEAGLLAVIRSTLGYA